MRFVGRLVVWCVLLSGGLACWAAGTSQAALSTESGGVSLLSASLVTAASPEQAGEMQAEREAKLATPEAVAERLVSRKQYEGLHGEEAVALAKQVFAIGRPSWTAPDSAGEGRITKYLGENTATEVSSSGQHLMLDSTVPLRSAVGSGQLAPTSLTLEKREGTYVPANPLVPVSIAGTPGGGVSLPLGISVAPVQAAAPEGSVVVGDKVVYPGTATDTDFMVEPVPAGIEASWQLLGEDSPSENALQFRLPAGASLQLSQRVPGGAEVVKEGETLESIRPATAVEADGTSLPVAYTVKGDTLTMRVDLEGSVAFPVVVDPIVEAEYGVYSGARSWPGWIPTDNCTDCYGFTANENELSILIGADSWNSGSYGFWFVYAPGAGNPGGAGIARVDLGGLSHYSEESLAWAALAEDNGPHPVWTFNGTVGAQGEGEYASTADVSNYILTLCADGAGGHEGGEQPLCNENYSAEDFQLGNEVFGTTSGYNYTVTTGAVVHYLDTTPPNVDQLDGLPTGWVKHGPSTTYIGANDQGVGIADLRVETPPGYENSKKEVYFLQEFACTGWNGLAGCQHNQLSSNISFAGLETGVHELGVYAFDAAGNVREEEVGESGGEQQGSGKRPTLYVDHTPPVVPPFGGSLAEDAGGGIGSGSYALTFSGEDGSSAAPQSGVRSLRVAVDGAGVYETRTSCPEPKGIPSAGCYALSGSWSMEGARYGVGSHTVTVTATDWMGNESARSMVVTVNEAPYEAAGPGSVNLKTGAFQLEAADATLAAAGANLAVGRTYNSRKLTAGASGPLGPQWSLSLPVSSADGEWQSLRAMSTGSVQATAANGALVTFTPTEKGFSSPAGYQTLTLSKTSTSPLEYQITDASGNATIFQRASSSEEEAPLLVPSVVEQAAAAGGLNKVTYKFTTTAESITEPTEMVAPAPSSINCVTELVQGCRALEFKYDTATTAEGEAPNQWGEYKGRLKEVKATAWSTSEKKMVSVTVADYLWSSRGYLRAEWNPQISPALKTTYGYDSEGDVTAEAPPGLQPWLFHYGTTGGDANPGRLLSVSRPGASTELTSSAAPLSTAVPTLSTTHPAVGTALSVTNGAWSNTPLAYSYQWERCNAAGAECAAILGASNQSYTPLLADTGHTLAAEVTATNATGSAVVATAASSAVPIAAPAYTSTLGTSGTGGGQLENPEAIAVAPSGNVWVADSSNRRLQEFSSSGAFIEAIGWGVSDGKEEFETCTSSCRAGIAGGGTGQFKDAEGIAINQSSGNIYVVDSAEYRVQEFSPTGTFIRVFGGFGNENGELYYPHGVGIDGAGDVWVADSGNCRVEEFTATGAFLKTFGECGKTAGKFENPVDVAIAESNVYVTDTGNSRVQESKPSGEWIREFGSSGTEPGKFTEPWGIATDPLNGNLYITSYGDGRVEAFTPQGSFVEQFGHFGSEPGELEDQPASRSTRAPVPSTSPMNGRTP